MEIKAVHFVFLVLQNFKCISLFYFTISATDECSVFTNPKFCESNQLSTDQYTELFSVLLCDFFLNCAFILVYFRV